MIIMDMRRMKVASEIWKVFVDDPDVLGRYLLAGESFDRPAGTTWTCCS